MVTKAPIPKAPIRVLKVRTRPRREVPEDTLTDVPFLRVTPKRSQVSLGRDALVVLGRPPKIMWEIHNGNLPKVPEGENPAAFKVQEKVRIRVVAADAEDEGGYVISYGKIREADGSEKPRPAGLTTVPAYIGRFLTSRRYYSIDWSKPTEYPRWFEFTFRSTVPTTGAVEAVAHNNPTSPEAPSGSHEGGIR